jgi:hypothetical protein
VTAFKQPLLYTLAELDQAGKSTHGKSQTDLPALYARIDDLAKQLPRGTDPSLLHYLRKKSSANARLFPSGRDFESQPGDCRHI